MIFISMMNIYNEGGVKMSQLDTYMNTLYRKKEELTKLYQDLSKEQAKLPPLKQKILTAENTINRTKNQSTIKSKINDIERTTKAINDLEKKINEIQKKIAIKQKEIVTAEKNYRNEEVKTQKKQLEIDKKRIYNDACEAKELKQRILQNEINQVKMQFDIEQLKNIPETITILFLAANPLNTEQLRLDEEARSIQRNIRLSDYRNSIKFESRWAVQTQDILQAINETDPTIVHFSGHGSSNGDLVFQDVNGKAKIVKKEAIAAAMATASDTIRLIVFNACFSQEQALNVVDHVESVIGMSTSIGDTAACVFAARLYSSIGFGLSLKKSFDQAIAQLMLENILEDNTPMLFVKENINPDNIIFVKPKN